MSNAEKPAERRASRREQRRLPCEVLVDGRRLSAVTLDLSESGLSLRIRADLDPGCDLRVVMRRPGGEIWEIDACVSRLRESGDKRALVTSRGVGLRIVQAPAGYHRYLAELDGV